MDAELIYNPVAGPWDSQSAMRLVCRFLARHGWSVSLQTTQKSGDAARIARQAADRGRDVVIVAGGDGTVNEAVNGLVGTETALAVLPVGTGNLWAKQLRLPTHSVTAPLRLYDVTAGLLSAEPRKIDLGCVDGHHFLCWAGIGLDAEVTKGLEPRDRHTKRLGVIPYAVATVLVARHFQGFRTWVQVDGHTVRGRALMVLVSNIRQYAGYFNIATQARIDDGLLDVFIFKGMGFPYAIRHLLTVIGRRHLSDPSVVHRQARTVSITTETLAQVQVDGDPVGVTPVEIAVVPRALTVLAPPSTPKCLFSEA
jgi:diacylglycerol kinase (ATP)